MGDQVRINNIIYSWTSVILKIDGDRYEGFQSFDGAKEKRERKLVYGARKNGRPLGRTSGKYIPGPVTIKFLKRSANLLLTYLSLKGLGSYGDAEFIAQLQVSEPGYVPITSTLLDCTIEEANDSAAEGSDELTKDLIIQPLTGDENGMVIWSKFREIGV